jgi:uncharacterized protein (TIGR03089 family)
VTRPVTPYDLLRQAVASDGARPLVTHYDDATGERVELSVATFDNWVAKTANLLQDGLAVEPGERVGVALPLHWQTLVAVTACWAAGAVAVPLREGATAPGRLAAAFVAADRLDAVQAGDVLALSLLPLGAPLPAGVALPPGAMDYALEVPSYGDRFAAYAPVGSDDPAVELGGAVLTHAELVEQAGAHAAAEGWAPGARLLTTREPTGAIGLTAALLAPLVLGGSVVLCRHADPGALDGRRAAERVTAEVH